MRILATTDKGLVREINQDYYYISEANDNEYSLYILADGMGGYAGGEVASKLAVESVVEYIEKNISKTEKTKENLQKLIKDAAIYANKTVYEKSKSDIKLSEMGTTLDACLIYNNKVYIGHIGDSRVYRIRKSIIRKLTTDHSYVEKLVRDGTITREESYHHPKKNMLIKALGCQDYVEPDALIKGFLKDDILLLCSDGLTNMLTDKEIYEIIINNPENADKILIEKAKDNGGYDNITAVIIQNN